MALERHIAADPADFGHSTASLSWHREMVKSNEPLSSPGRKQRSRASRLVSIGPEIADFGDTMAILRHVERLVTIDTSVAHIAGASGVPTALMLPRAPDWRWLLGREDTPWYPNMRLFRQERAYDWSGVVERVSASI